MDESYKVKMLIVESESFLVILDYLSISIYPSVLSINPNKYASIFIHVYLPTYISILLSLSIYLSIYLSIHLSIHPSICYLSSAATLHLDNLLLEGVDLLVLALDVQLHGLPQEREVIKCLNIQHDF